jgi:hypothetical protein
VIYNDDDDNKIVLLACPAGLPPYGDVAMMQTQLLPRHLPHLHPLLLRLVGSQGRGGNDDDNVNPRGDNNNDTKISLKIGRGERWSGRQW